MADIRDRLRTEARRAPEPSFSLDDVWRRRDRAQRRRRVSGAIVGVGLTVSMVVIGIAAVGPLAGSPHAGVPGGGAGLPARTREMPSIGQGQYSYQHVTYAESCETVDCLDLEVNFESWWTWDDSGRIDIVSQRNYGFEDGSFGPGRFPTEGDVRDFPLDPESLRVFLLERSDADGASPRPDVTPSPSVPLDEGLLWNAIRDYLGSRQYLNTTPQLRASMLEVLATLSMVHVEAGARDPVGRDAIVLRFVAYGQDISVYVDPATHDFLALTGRYLADGSTETMVVRSAGAVASPGDVPTGTDRSIPEVP